MDLENFVTASFRDRLGADLIAVSSKSIPGTKFVLVKVRGCWKQRPWRSK